MRHVFILFILILTLGTTTTQAQPLNVLDKIDEIISSIADLKSRLDGISSQIDAQATRVADLDSTLSAITDQWPQVEKATAYVGKMQSQLGPIIERIPQIESQLQALDSIQTGLTDRYERLNESLVEMTGNLPGNSRSELGNFQAETESVISLLVSRDQEIASLRTQLGNLQLLIYLGLGLIVGIALILFAAMMKLKQPGAQAP